MAPSRRTQTTGTANPGRHIRGRQGALQNFLDMPFDIIEEVFNHLLPIDLLNIARTNKQFRRDLLKKESESIWKNARMNVPGLPGPFPGMSEPRFASLCFETRCERCSKPGVRNITWELQARLCNECMDIETVYGSDVLGVKVDVGKYTILPHVGWELNKTSIRVIESEALQILHEFRSLKTLEERNHFITLQKIRCMEIEQHSQLMRDWTEAKNNAHKEELRLIKEERYQMIVDKLTDLGYKPEIDFLEVIGVRLSDRPGVRHNYHLTERAWKTMKPSLITYLRDDIRPRRIGYMYRVTLKERFHILRQAVELMSRRSSNVFPHAEYLANLPEVRRILDFPQDGEAPDPITVDSFEAITPYLPRIINEWYQVATTAINRHLCGAIEGRFVKDTSNLAITQILYCKHCKTSLLNPIHTMTTHKCQYAEFHDHLYVKYEDILGLKDWAVIRALGFIPLQGITENILAVCGRDKYSTTVDEMDALDPKLICDMEPCSIETVLNWREAALHCFIEHVYDSYDGEVPEAMMSQPFGYWKLLSQDKAAKVALLQNNARARYQEETKWISIWLCTHCNAPPVNKYEIEDHLRRSHDIRSPNDSDTCLAPEYCQTITDPVYLIDDTDGREVESLPPPVRQALDMDEAAFYGDC
ncbi:hypothetical protein QCA50_004617 [Cerrena zonata]|uniref:F-box domain-containing protein n=1 Tax=Cerrena zonata TaxID=2478898 RepID=A0AAW0GI12_9APHY